MTRASGLDRRIVTAAWDAVLDAVVHRVPLSRPAEVRVVCETRIPLDRLGKKELVARLQRHGSAWLVIRDGRALLPRDAGWRPRGGESAAHCTIEIRHQRDGSTKLVVLGGGQDLRKVIGRRHARGRRRGR